MREKLVQEIRYIVNCRDKDSRIEICLGCLVDYLLTHYQMISKQNSKDHKVELKINTICSYCGQPSIESIRKAILLIASSCSTVISMDDFNKIVDLLRKDNNGNITP